MAHWPLRFPLSLCRTTLRSGLRQRFGDVQSQQQVDRRLEVEAAKLIRPRLPRPFWSRNLRHDLITA
jgi:hypothetical protein